MDLKLLLSPVQKDPEASSAQNNDREDHATDSRPNWQYHPQDQQQPYPQRPQQPPQEPYPAHPHESYPPQGPHQSSRSHDPQHPYYQHHEQHPPPHYPQDAPMVAPSYYGASQQHSSHYEQQHPDAMSQQRRGMPGTGGHDRMSSHPQDQPQQHFFDRPSGYEAPSPRPAPFPAPPLLSISASTPLVGETPQPPQYFVPTHRSTPPVLPPPSGLNLSSYSFLLMEKRDREREAMERANRGYLMGEGSGGKNESSSHPGSPSLPARAHPSRTSSPRIDDARPSSHMPHATQGSFVSPQTHAPHAQHPPPEQGAASYGYAADAGRYPTPGYDAPSAYRPSGHPQQVYPPYQPYPSSHAAPPPPQQGYPHQPHQQQHSHHHAQGQHHYHSSGSSNIGPDSLYHRPQDYASEPHGPSSFPNHPLHHQSHNLHHRAMSPSLLDKPRFANANLSVFRQSAAEDSDGNASVSSSGSLKRRRRPTKTSDGKKSLLPGSALGASAQGGLGHYLMSRTSSHGSAEGQEDFYDDNSSDEQLDVRNGLQGLNLQKSIKSSASDRPKKVRTKTEKRPFKIGELVESMKSDTDGTWFAGRVLDLEDDPHDHINPKSVLIHFEGFSPHHDEWVKPGQLRACSTGSSFLRYGPNGHEPAENWIAYEKFYHSDLGRIARRHTGLAYDRRMLLHKCQCNTNPEERHHPEQPERLVEILCQFQKNGMLSLVKWIQGREATIEELVAAHTDTHVRNYCCTAAQNRQYALENGLIDTDLQLEDEVLDEGDEAEDEEEEEEDDSAEPEDESGDYRGPAPKKSPEKRGRPRRGPRASTHVSTTATSASEAEAAGVASGTKVSEDVEMAQSTSPTEASKDSMDVDLHSPALGRRRSSMRGSVVRMSSLVSMSSTLYAQKEEDMVPDEVKAAALVQDDDDDDDDDKVGPAPSEAALAVAGGMDPSLASQLPNSPRVIPKLEVEGDAKITGEPLDQGEKAGSTEEGGEDASKQDIETEAISAGTSGAPAEDIAQEKPKLEAGISSANVIEGARRSSRSVQGQSGATVVLPETAKTQDADAAAKSTVPDVADAEDAEAVSKSRERKASDKYEQPGKEDGVTKIVGSKKKGHQAVSPAPATSNSVIIRPPGLTFTMSCGQLGIAVDTTWNSFHSSTAAKVAAGSLITLVDQVVTGRCKNGFAIIRPPGHHAEEDEAMGFCFFNNVGVAVNLTLSRYPLTVQKILVIDWDVHHGNGTQQIFYENPNVLYISLHRWDNGHFYPFTGAPDECGEEAGEGKNVNIAWSSYGRGQAMGDVEYIAAFWYVLLPIARQFQPDLVMVSAGFDAADGHAANIGGYTVSPQGFAILTRLVQTLAGGRVILSLEGGYEFEPLALSATACLEELLPHSLLPATAPTRAFPFASFQGTLNSVKPNAMAVSSLHQVLKYQQKYWKFPAEVLNPSFRFQLPAEWKASNSLATRPRRERNTRRKAPALDS